MNSPKTEIQDWQRTQILQNHLRTQIHINKREIFKPLKQPRQYQARVIRIRNPCIYPISIRQFRPRIRNREQKRNWHSVRFLTVLEFIKYWSNARYATFETPEEQAYQTKPVTSYQLTAVEESPQLIPAVYVSVTIQPVIVLVLCNCNQSKE